MSKILIVFLLIFSIFLARGLTFVYADSEVDPNDYLLPGQTQADIDNSVTITPIDPRDDWSDDD